MNRHKNLTQKGEEYKIDARLLEEAESKDVKQKKEDAEMTNEEERELWDGSDEDEDAVPEGEDDNLESGKLENAVLDVETEVWRDEQSEERDEKAERELTKELVKEGLE